VDDDTIVEVLEKTAEKYGSRSDDELAEYDSVKQIRSDSSISAEERKRRELTWQRKVGRPVR
jgi:hypothetical protein